VFKVALILPSVIVILGLTTLIMSFPARFSVMVLFIGLVVLKFFDEWLRYTLVATTRPILFQPIPIKYAVRCSRGWGVLPNRSLWVAPG
jgi:hypothetical protein